MYKNEIALLKCGYGTTNFTMSVFIFQIHFNLAEYHEVGRFSRDHLPDLKSSMYHLTKSAQCGTVGALYMLARIHLQQPREKFWDLIVEVYWGCGTCRYRGSL